MIDGIRNWIDVADETNRVEITIGDNHDNAKSIELTPRAAHELAVEIATAAYEAMGIKNPVLYIGVGR